MDDIKIVWDDAAVKLWAEHSPQAHAALDLVAARAVVTMKALCPVSPVQPVYARPLPVGSSAGKTRYQGDLPLRASGTLRSSIHAFRLPDGAVIVGPTAPYAEFVNSGTRPHVITSHGSWPLRSRATGQVFGRVVHHPGTQGSHFIERTAATLGGVRVHV